MQLKYASLGLIAAAFMVDVYAIGTNYPGYKNKADFEARVNGGGANANSAFNSGYSGVGFENSVKGGNSAFYSGVNVAQAGSARTGLSQGLQASAPNLGADLSKGFGTGAKVNVGGIGIACKIGLRKRKSGIDSSHVHHAFARRRRKTAEKDENEETASDEESVASAIEEDVDATKSEEVTLKASGQESIENFGLGDSKLERRNPIINGLPVVGNVLGGGRSTSEGSGGIIGAL